MRGHRRFLPLKGRLRLQQIPLLRRRALATGSADPERYKSVSLSQDAEVRRLKELVKSLPDVRQDKIESIKKQIDSGVYDAPAESVAESIADMARLLREKAKNTKPD